MSGPVLIMAGGTGGHIFPGLAVAQELKVRGIAVEWLGSAGGMETELVPKHDIPMHTVRVDRLRGQRGLTRLMAPIRLARAVLQALRVVFRMRPSAVLSMGGFAAGPGGFAAWLLRRPLVVHEQNSVAGWTNRLLARFARRLLCGFPSALGRRSEFVGNPIRQKISAAPLADRADRQCRVLVLGGSQGALAINREVPLAISSLPAARRPEVLHQAGRGKDQSVIESYSELDIQARVEPFIEDMAQAYAWADLIIARAGALTLAEICGVGRASLLIPYPSAVDDHQTHNARYLVEAGAAVLIPEQTLPESLPALLADLVDDHLRLERMGAKADGCARRDATTRVADALVEVMR